MSTYKRLDLETLGSRLIMLKTSHETSLIYKVPQIVQKRDETVGLILH